MKTGKAMVGGAALTLLLLAAGGVMLLKPNGGGDGRNTVLATVADKPVADEQFQAYLSASGIRGASGGQRQVLMDRFLNDVAMAAVIERDADDGLAAVEAEVAQFRRELILRRHFEKLLSERLSDQAVQEYIDAHPEEFQRHQVRVAHLLLRTSSQMSEQEKAAKLAEAKALHRRLAAGEDFAELAARHSEDLASAPRGGELGWISQSTITPELFDTALALDVRAVSEPIETSHGYHLVQVLEAPRQTEAATAAARLKARETLRQEIIAAEQQRLLAAAGVERVEPVEDVGGNDREGAAGPVLAQKFSPAREEATR